MCVSPTLCIQHKLMSQNGAVEHAADCIARCSAYARPPTLKDHAHISTLSRSHPRAHALFNLTHPPTRIALSPASVFRPLFCAWVLALLQCSCLADRTGDALWASLGRLHSGLRTTRVFTRAKQCVCMEGEEASSVSICCGSCSEILTTADGIDWVAMECSGGGEGSGW
jgi:hypothetical protein